MKTVDVGTETRLYPFASRSTSEADLARSGYVSVEAGIIVPNLQILSLDADACVEFELIFRRARQIAELQRLHAIVLEAAKLYHKASQAGAATTLDFINTNFDSAAVLEQIFEEAYREVT